MHTHAHTDTHTTHTYAHTHIHTWCIATSPIWPEVARTFIKNSYGLFNNNTQCDGTIIIIHTVISFLLFSSIEAPNSGVLFHIISVNENLPPINQITKISYPCNPTQSKTLSTRTKLTHWSVVDGCAPAVLVSSVQNNIACCPSAPPAYRRAPTLVCTHSVPRLLLWCFFGRLEPSSSLLRVSPAVNTNLRWSSEYSLSFRTLHGFLCFYIGVSK